MCAFLSSFPFGIYTVLRKFARSTRQTVPIADSALTLYSEEKGEGKLSAEAHARLKPVIDAIGQGWAHDLHTTLAHAGETMVVPRMIVLSAHSHFEFFKTQLEKSAPVGSTPAISPLELSMVDEVVTYDRGQERSIRMAIYATAIAGLL
jgi:GTP:adenosylcobinamide-phosphate guanylyltransferase